MLLNFVLLIWEERNSGRYEHVRACREQARAPRASKKVHQPSNDICMKMLSVLAGFCSALHEPGWQTGFDTGVRAATLVCC
jgi:hypothetical protein